MRGGAMGAGRRAMLVWLLAGAGAGAAWAQPSPSASVVTGPAITGLASAPLATAPAGSAAVSAASAVPAAATVTATATAAPLAESPASVAEGSASAAAVPASTPAGPASAVAGPASAAAALAPGASAAAASASAPGPRLVTQVIQPRAFGHVLGDVLVQRVLLEHAGRRLVPTALPPADRVGRWFERRAPRTERDAQGRDWLVIEHQLINAPRLITTTALPALSVKTGSGEVVAVPAWPLSIGPLTLAESPGLQGDRPVLPHDTRAVEFRLWAALGSLAAVLLAWAGWWAWRHWREAQRLPFAQAARQVRRLDAADPAAWQALHAAINRSAGRVVHAASLPEWLAEAPHLQPLRGDLEAFFAASNARFFGAAETAPTMALRPLAQALRASERRHQR